MNLLEPFSIQSDHLNYQARWSLHQDLGELEHLQTQRSIETFGLLRLPVVMKSSANRFELVCGLRRIKIWVKILKHETIPCLVLPHSLHKKDFLLLIAEDQRLSGDLTPIERARFVRLCADQLQDDYVETARAGIGINNLHYIKKLPRLLDLEKPIMVSIHDGYIHEKTGFELLTFAKEDRILLHNLFLQLALNFNKQRRIIDLGRIITNREQCSWVELLSEYQLAANSRDGLVNIPQMASKMMTDLSLRSRPSSTGMEKRFKEKVRQLELPDYCKLIPAKSFERDTVTFSVTFDNIDTFANSWPGFKDLLDQNVPGNK